MAELKQNEDGTFSLDITSREFADDAISDLQDQKAVIAEHGDWFRGMGIDPAALTALADRDIAAMEKLRDQAD